MARRTVIQPVAKRIFLVEEHGAFSEGLAPILEKEGDLIICGVVRSVATALPGIKLRRPDLVLLNIALPDKSSLELIKQLRKSDPQVRLLVLSGHDEPLYADRALRAGGDGYILRQEDTEEIIHAIRDVLAGRVYVSEAVFEKSEKAGRRTPRKAVARATAQLAGRELEILAQLGCGRNAGEISRQLDLPLREIKRITNEMRQKLKLKSAKALVRYAISWVETHVT